MLLELPRGPSVALPWVLHTSQPGDERLGVPGWLPVLPYRRVVVIAPTSFAMSRESRHHRTILSRGSVQKAALR